MDKKLETDFQEEKDIIEENFKSKNEPEKKEPLETEEKIEEDKIKNLKEHLKNILKNSYATKSYDKNILNLKLEFYMNLKNYIENLKKLHIDLSIENNNVFLTNIELFLMILGNIPREILEKNFSLEKFLFSIKEISLEKSIECLNNNAFEIKIEKDFIEKFKKIIESLETILKADNGNEILNKKIEEIENKEELEYHLAFNYLEELYQDSEIVLTLTNSFLKYTTWIESLLEIIIKENKDKPLNEKIIDLIERIIDISNKVLKNKIINFDLDEETNFLNEILSLDEDIRKNYKGLVDIDKVYYFSANHLIEKAPHLEEKFNIFISKEKKNEYIKSVPIILEQLNEKLEKKKNRGTFRSILNFFGSMNNNDEDTYEIISEETLVLIKKLTFYFSFINVETLISDEEETEQFKLLNKITVTINKKKEKYSEKIEQFKELENLTSEDKKILQEYENAIYIFRNFLKVSKKFLIEKSENRNKKDVEE